MRFQRCLIGFASLLAWLTSTVAYGQVNALCDNLCSVDCNPAFDFNQQTRCLSPCCTNHIAGNWSAFIGLEGSKQPQDFGVNANLGGRGRISYSAPLFPKRNIGFQLGTAVSATANAVQVFELLGESKDRFQSFSTAGVYQRIPGGIGWGVAYDFLYQDSFDTFQLSQWRFQASFEVGPRSEVGAIVNLPGKADDGVFNNTVVRLEPMEMLRLFAEHQWPTNVSTRVWVGVVDGHNENNVVTGPLPRVEDQFQFGASLVVPLSHWVAISGEANITMPADTGTVDAFLGIEIYSGGFSGIVRANPYRSMFSVAGGPSFAADLFLQ